MENCEERNHNRTFDNNNNEISNKNGIVVFENIFLRIFMHKLKKILLLKEMLNQRYQASIKINSHIKCIFTLYLIFL